ncbi:MAG: phosphoenolpyruvate kinase [Acidobacteria bacterium]|nr:phosphoenolpyruvate kinase [Acidobacteriota bacterium]
MKTTLQPEDIRPIEARLREANAEFARRYPGESGRRQPVHTVYGGAHLFKSDIAARLGQVALRTLDEFAPDPVVFARALGLPGADTLPESRAQAIALSEQLARDPDSVRGTHRAAWLAHTVYTRVREKLRREPVEDFRLDFEDGYGNRPDPEEDSHAAAAAAAVAAGMDGRTLPPFLGIRLKPFSAELHARSVRTLDIFLSTLVGKTGGELPPNFVVTLPKVALPDQVAALADLFELLEARLGLAPSSLKIELMIETPQAILDARGASAVPHLIAVGRGRTVAAHFGTYDYTASCHITAAHQHMTHPACDFARHMMQVALAGTGLWLSDGATNIMPVAPHRAAEGGPPLTPEQEAENRRAVHRAWKLHYDHIQHSLIHGYYQGWDLHPAQLPTRYAAVYAFFLESLEAASERLRNFVEQAARATLIGEVFDDAATGQGLLNFFLRALNCGAITEKEALATGLTLEELRLRSFVKILARRRQRGV